MPLLRFYHRLLYELVNTILNDLDYDSLNTSQKIKLLEVALKYSLPKLSIEKPYEEPETPQDIQITIIDGQGNKEVRKKSIEGFKFSDLARRCKPCIQDYFF